MPCDRAVVACGSRLVAMLTLESMVAPGQQTLLLLEFEPKINQLPPR